MCGLEGIVRELRLALVELWLWKECMPQGRPDAKASGYQALFFYATGDGQA
jgi:hypothetical protein